MLQDALNDTTTVRMRRQWKHLQTPHTVFNYCQLFPQSIEKRVVWILRDEIGYRERGYLYSSILDSDVDRLSIKKNAHFDGDHTTSKGMQVGWREIPQNRVIVWVDQLSVPRGRGVATYSTRFATDRFRIKWKFDENFSRITRYLKWAAYSCFSRSKIEATSPLTYLRGFVGHATNVTHWKAEKSETRRNRRLPVPEKR